MVRPPTYGAARARGTAMQTFQWARLNENVKTPLRRGAWYRILKLTSSEATVDVKGKPVSLPRGELQLSPTPAQRWTVVPAPKNAPRFPASGGAPSDRADVECGAGRARRPRRRRAQRVTRPGFVNAQIPEQSDAVDRRHGRRAGEPPADRIGADRNSYTGGEAAVHIAQRVLYLHLDRRGDHVARRDVARLDPEDQQGARRAAGRADGNAAGDRLGGREAAGRGDGDERNAERRELHTSVDA